MTRKIGGEIKRTRLINGRDRALAFGQRVKQIAIKVGGNEELSKKINLSTTIISKYISGKAEPTLHNLIAIAKAGDVDLNWLALGSEEPTDEKHDHEATPYGDIVRMVRIVGFVDDWLETNKLQITKDSRVELIVFLLEEHDGKTFDEQRIKILERQLSHITKIVRSELSKISAD